MSELLRVVASALVLACACSAAPAPRNDTPRVASETTPKDCHLHRPLSFLDAVLGTRAPEDSNRTDALTLGCAELDEEIEARLDQELFYRTFVPQLFGVLNDPRVARSHVVPKYLKPFSIDGRKAHYLKEKCSGTELEEVRPWWNMSEPILVCKSAYQPQITKDVSANAFCEASNNGAYEVNECACGEHLVNCAKDRKQRQVISSAMRNEFIDTVSAVIRDDRNISEILTVNETVRTEPLDFFYERLDYFATGKPVFSTPNFDSLATRKPRPKRFSAGVLSTPFMIYFDEALRSVAATVWDEFMCVPFYASGVNAHDVFAVQNPNLRRLTQFGLVEMKGCQNCHARLEYGMQAMGGFVSGRYGMRYSQRRETPMGKLYVRDHRDPRGEGPATLNWLGRTIAAQPEFRECMVMKVEEVILGPGPYPQGTHEALMEELQSAGRLRPVIKMALRQWIVAEPGQAQRRELARE